MFTIREELSDNKKSLSSMQHDIKVYLTSKQIKMRNGKEKDFIIKKIMPHHHFLCITYSI